MSTSIGAYWSGNDGLKVQRLQRWPGGAAAVRPWPGRAAAGWTWLGGAASCQSMDLVQRLTRSGRRP
ncbi:hypothetical protein [Paenibacillus sp. 1P07SE]|uniref:hypothetical protein n=1 Tax=Paenibacillus sp. 1P07SE TaxID=3132209 RepID=UPI0039A74CB7